MLMDDTTKGEHVDGEKKGAQHWALWHTLVDWGWSGAKTLYSDELFPVGEVRLEPGESCSGKAEVFG